MIFLDHLKLVFQIRIYDILISKWIISWYFILIVHLIESSQRGTKVVCLRKNWVELKYLITCMQLPYIKIEII